MKEEVSKEIKKRNLGGKPKGLPKSGGRPKGVPNKDRSTVLEIAQSVGCDPFKILCQFAMGDFKGLGIEEFTTKIGGEGAYEAFSISPELRQKSAKDACEYLYPKRKAVEHSGSIDSVQATLTLEEYLKQQEGK